MALADLVLEGLTLILAIALGLVLIGGLTYLTMTVTSANNARLAYVGLYIYLPQPFYANGTLYVPMLNIGYYKALVRYVYVRAADGSMHVYAPDLVLSPNQYYVYRLNLDYEPSSVTVVASPVNYPSVVREFSVNASEVTTVPIMTLSGSGSSSGLIEVVVNDPYNAGWSVTWSYAGQSFSMGQSQSYMWWLNPPYVPIQISFTAGVTQNPSGYTCQIQPSSITNTYSAGSIQEFNVTCQQQQGQPPGSNGGSSISVLVVNDSLGAGWSVAWSGGASGSKSGSSDASWVISNPSGTVTFTASITSNPSGYTCSISPTWAAIYPGHSIQFTINCYSGGTQPRSTIYGCIFTLSVSANPSSASSGVSSIPSQGTYFIQSGQSLSGSISAQPSVPGNSQSNSEEWYQFEDWLLTYSGTGTFLWNNVQISSGTTWTYAKNTGSFEYECPSSLSQNVTATFTAVANYYSDYVTITGPESITVSGSGTYDASYTLTWSVNPYSAANVTWILNTGNPFSITGYLYGTSNNKLGQAGENPSITCKLPNGGSAQPIINSESLSATSNQTTLTQQVSGSTGSTIVTVYISYTCPSTYT